MRRTLSCSFFLTICKTFAKRTKESKAVYKRMFGQVHTDLTFIHTFHAYTQYIPTEHTSLQVCMHVYTDIFRARIQTMQIVQDAHSYTHMHSHTCMKTAYPTTDMVRADLRCHLKLRRLQETRRRQWTTWATPQTPDRARFAHQTTLPSWRALAAVENLTRPTPQNLDGKLWHFPTGEFRNRIGRSVRMCVYSVCMEVHVKLLFIFRCRYPHSLQRVTCACAHAAPFFFLCTRPCMGL